MIKFSSFLDEARNRIYDRFKVFANKSEDEIDYDSLNGIIELISNNEKEYRLFLTILFLDDYRLKFRYLMNNEAKEEEKQTIAFYDEYIYDVDDIIDYVETEGDIFDMISSTLVFVNLDSNQKRDVITSSWIKNKYLSSVTPLHILDLLYYSFPISLDNFLELYRKYNEEKNSLDASNKAILEFSDEIKDLYISDPNNYKKIVDSLIETYKIIKYNKVFEDDELDMFVLKKDLDLYNSLYCNSHVREKLLEFYLDYFIICTDEERISFQDKYGKVKKKKAE